MIDQIDGEEQHWKGRALDLASQLRREIVSFQAWVAENLRFDDEAGQNSNTTSDSTIVILGSNLDRVAALVIELDRLLERGGFDGKAVPLDDGEIWGFGTYDLRFDHRAIYNGFLEPVLRRPIVEKLTERVVAYLITINGDDDLLERERGGGIGWHYHYLNKWKQRSDVVLAWDTRADVDHRNRGIFSEKHAARWKKFAARPGSWNDTKRQTIHTACSQDFERWNPAEFRNASDEASPVWPKDAVLTPRSPAAPSGAAAASARSALRR